MFVSVQWDLQSYGSGEKQTKNSRQLVLASKRQTCKFHWVSLSRDVIGKADPWFKGLG